MESSTEEKFLAAVEIIKNLPKSGPIKPSNELKLKFYSYYKQATEGPCEIPKPSFWDIVNRAKWDAWNKLENMSKEEAMKHYVEEFVGECLSIAKTRAGSALVDNIMKETIPRDPESVNEFYNMMGPYLDLVPEEIKAKHGLVNGNPLKLLNNNTLGIFGPILTNGVSNINGNCNDSDSDEFSDTLEQVNERESDDIHNSLADEEICDGDGGSERSSAKGSILNVRGGGDQMPRSGDAGSSAAGLPGARAARSSRPARSADNPLHYIANNNNIGGAGGSRRSGGNDQYDVAVDANEQLALAVIRLQHIMEQVVVRLDSLEVLLTQRQPPPQQVSSRHSRWSLGVSYRAALFFLAWPFVVQWLLFLYRRKYKRT